ncbi:acetyl-CoA synthetase-like protein [Fomitiporia mediterranea MF3/22]|uniref:acetyl-CoA synthetase-like protein n=1 Tax=Fomitiporia mediterranea (strain MF3/22) TaxID=694068 RepID=UPI0004408864|nr:acetyl-CoA synthetase-like protein [Fomitiporia mediterranea MF3/22]EJD05486.1 acetyl-CoA synthetase-like protein [Fomitiporia mediterranea MF3/22]
MTPRLTRLRAARASLSWRRRLTNPVRCLLTQSYVEGAKTPPLSEATLASYFEDKLLSKLSSRPALICKKERPQVHGGRPQEDLRRSDCLAWSFQEFHRHIEGLSYGLLSLGIKKGDRVAVVMGNTSAYATLQWACAKIGAILVTINPAYRVHELISTLKLVGVSTLVVVPRIRTSSYLTALAEAIPSLASCRAGEIQIEELPELRNILIVNNTEDGEFNKLLRNVKCAVDFREAFEWYPSPSEVKAVDELQRAASNDDIINLQFTSGTTGMPKAVSLTHKNLLNNGISIGRCMRLTPDDTLCNVPPLFHCFGLVLGNLAAWTQGACIVYPSDIFHPSSIVDAVVQEKCTALHGVPTHFLGVLSEMEKRRTEGEQLDFRRLRTGIAAGSSVPIGLMRRLIQELHLNELTIAYGMTETSPVSFQTSPDDPLDKRVETVGRIQPHVKAKIIDTEGKVVPVGTPGEICVAGYLVQKGYWGDEDQTKAAVKTHSDDPHTLWMHSGDIGVMDEEGYLRVVGRIKDVIIRGGENLFPVVIENRVSLHPKISEAAAVAVPDPKYGEVVGAWITLADNASLSREEIRKWVAEEMNPQNAPAWVWFVGEDGVPPALPKTASGKIQKHILRDWAKDLVARGIGRVRE